MELFILGLILFLMLLIAILFWAILGRCWCKCGGFFHTHYSFFDAVFIFGYFFEEFILTLLLFLYPSLISLWAGLFGILIVTTAAFQKFTLERRLDNISQRTIEQKMIIDNITKKNEALLNDNRKLRLNAENMRDFIIELLNYLRESSKKR